MAIKQQTKLGLEISLTVVLLMILDILFHAWGFYLAHRFIAKRLDPKAQDREAHPGARFIYTGITP